MSVTTLDAATIAAALRDAGSVASAANRLRVCRQRLRARCLADDVLRPLFCKLADRGRTHVRVGMKRLRWTEAG